MYIVVLDRKSGLDLYLASWDNDDPPGTYLIDNAKVFESEEMALEGIKKSNGFNISPNHQMYPNAKVLNIEPKEFTVTGVVTISCSTKITARTKEEALGLASERKDMMSICSNNGDSENNVWMIDEIDGVPYRLNIEDSDDGQLFKSK